MDLWIMCDKRYGEGFSIRACRRCWSPKPGARRKAKHIHGAIVDYVEVCPECVRDIVGVCREAEEGV